MPASDRGGLKSAFAGFRKTVDEDAERKLLGRTVDPPGQGSPEPATPAPVTVSAMVAPSYQPATNPVPPAAAVTPPPVPVQHLAAPSGGLVPRPLRQREAVRQLSFRCPVSLAGELRRKAAFNQLEQQEIIVEGIRRVLAEREEPPVGWSADL